MNGNARLAACGVAFLAAAGAALVAQRRPALGVRPIAADLFSAGKFDTLEITARGERTTLRRRADGFWVTAPVTYAADTAGATAAFEAIEKLEPGALVTTRAQRHGELQVDAAHGIGVRVLQGDRQRLDLVVGKTLDGGTLVQRRGGDAGPASDPTSATAPIWQLNGDLRVIFDKVTTEWRDRSITTFPVQEVRELAVDTRDGQQIRLRAGEPAAGEPPPRTGPRSWSVVRSSHDIPALDALVPTELLSTLSSLKASDFADGTTAAAAGLAPPELTITVTLGSGERDVLSIGHAAGSDDFFVKTNEGPQIFRVKAFNIERLAQRPIQFRNRLLCPLVDRDIEQITVKNGSSSFTVIRDSQGWRASAPRGLRIDSDKVAPLASTFRAWRAPRIAEDRHASDLAGRPAIVVSGSGPKGSCTVIAVADPNGHDSYLAQAPPGPDIFVLPRWMIDRVAVTLDAIRAR